MIVNLPFCDYYRQRKNKQALVAFYKRQKYIQECHDEDEVVLQRDHDDHQRIHQEDRDSKAVGFQITCYIVYNNFMFSRWDDILAKATLLINIIIIIAKLVAAYLSHSLSIISSVVDSVMDIACSGVIWGTLKSIDKTNPNEYPIGRTRLEPLAVLIVAMIMVFANIMVIYEATMAIIEDSLNPIVDVVTLIIVVTSTVAKVILYFLCRRQDTLSSKLLAQDQLNDVITNIVALAGAYAGHQYWKYCDPIGAYLVSGYIIVNWYGTAREQVPLLIGRTATAEFINRISRIAITHHEKILALDMVYAYHLGSNFLVEIHVLMDGSLSLFETHDISETLQTKIERLPYVERAFVHCDYKLDGDEHLKKFN